MKCGGAGNVENATEEVQTYAETIRGNLEAKVGKIFALFQAVKYRSQIVAGVNYFVKVQVDDNSYVHVRIFKPLPHTNQAPSLHSYQVDKTEDDSLEYF